MITNDEFLRRVERLSEEAEASGRKTMELKPDLDYFLAKNGMRIETTRYGGYILFGADGSAIAGFDHYNELIELVADQPAFRPDLLNDDVKAGE